MAREALEESRTDVTALFRDYSVIVLIGTGGKGTGAGTMFPLAQIAREQRKLVIPIFVRPSFEWHEVDKRRYDHALDVVDQFDSAGIRLIEILNDRGYSPASPASQSVVWERMNVPIARGLRGLLYVLSDLSQVDPPISARWARGRPIPHRLWRARSGARRRSERRPDRRGEPAVLGQRLLLVHEAGRDVSSAFRVTGRTSPTARSSVVLAPGPPGTRRTASTIRCTRDPHAPRPWGVTALFAEYTGIHHPLDVDWPLDSRVSLPPPVQAVARERVTVAAAEPVPIEVVVALEPPPVPTSFQTFRELCLGVNRRDAAAMAIAGNGATSEIPLNCARGSKASWHRVVPLRVCAIVARLARPNPGHAVGEFANTRSHGSHRSPQHSYE